MPAEPDFPSKSAINRAGCYLRDVVSGVIPRSEVDAVKLNEAIQTVTTFREAHGYPMTKIRNGLTSMINTEDLNAAVSQRHKRVPRIVRKLVRMEKTMCARLEDIGGCRIVVADGADMDKICRRIRKNWSSDFTRDPRDYVAEPKSIGYRARHFVVKRDDRAVEVQVRTVGQQRWADAVESLDSRRSDLELKDSEGPDVVLEYFRLAGEVIFCQEFGVPIQQDLVDAFAVAREGIVEAGYYTR